MPNLVTITPIPFDAVKLPYTFGYSFGGGGTFLQHSNAGPYQANGKIWVMTMNSVPEGGANAAVFLSVYSSVNGGSTWIEENAAGAPQLSANGINSGVRGDVTFGHDNVFYVAVAPQLAGAHVTVQSFNTATGLWNPAITGPLVIAAGGTFQNHSIYQNSTNTNLVILFTRGINPGVGWVRVTAGVFGAENQLCPPAITVPLGVIDSADVVRVFFANDLAVATYQAINTDDTLGVALPTTFLVLRGKPIIWQGVIMAPAGKTVAGSPEPFALMSSPAIAPTVFTQTQIFTESLFSSFFNSGNGMRMLTDGANALWMGWYVLSHDPGGNGDPVTESSITMMELCSPISAWGNHRVFWDQLTDPQTDQPLNDPDALSQSQFSLGYIPGTDTFKGIANISGFNQTYAYFLRSTTAVAAITACRCPKNSQGV